MKGTEEQIRLAEEIKKEANRVMNNYIASFEEKGKDAKKYRKQLEKFNKIDDAKFIIKWRSYIPDYRRMTEEEQKLMNPSLYDFIEIAEDFEII